jgi:hypothetical protein
VHPRQTRLNGASGSGARANDGWRGACFSHEALVLTAFAETDAQDEKQACQRWSPTPGIDKRLRERCTSWCLWSLRRLWVAVISRHSERAADLPRRWNWLMRRLCLVWANTGSIIALRFR